MNLLMMPQEYLVVHLLFSFSLLYTSSYSLTYIFMGQFFMSLCL